MNLGQKILLVISASVFEFASNAQALTLDEYLAKVSADNKGHVGAENQAKAASLKWSEGDLLFTPQFFAEVNQGSDGKPSNPPLLTYQKLQFESYSAGFAQQFSFGLKGRLYYQLSHTNYVNSPLLTGNNGDFYDANPRLELSIPLWSNGFGRSVRSQKIQIQQINRGEEYGAKALSLSLKMEAENTYWRLASARESLAIQRKALSQAESIFNYIGKKAHMRLGEDSDVLQAKALVAMRKLELKRAESEESITQKEFNALIGTLDSTPIGELDPIPFGELQRIATPTKRPGDRYDVMAQAAQAKLSSASARLIEERNKPAFDIFGNVGMNGRGDSTSNSLSDARGGDRGTYTVGVRLNIPLDLSATSNTRTGARLGEQAQHEQLSQKQILQEKDWNVLLQRLQDAKESLSYAELLVDAQSAKLKNGRTRLKTGRATTYEVLLFEQDLSQAEIARIQLASQILAVRSGLKLYQGQPVSGEEN